MVSPDQKNEFACFAQKNDYRRRLVAAGNRKSKACLNLELLLGQEFAIAALLKNILCRNCTDKSKSRIVKSI